MPLRAARWPGWLRALAMTVMLSTMLREPKSAPGKTDGQMGRYSKLKAIIQAGTADANVDFAAMCQLLVRLGFEQRVRGSHHIFTRADIEEILNLQPKGNKAKPYQVRQVRGILVKYRLGESDVD